MTLRAHLAEDRRLELTLDSEELYQRRLDGLACVYVRVRV